MNGENMEEVRDPRQLAQFLFRVIKRNRLNNVGTLKIIGLYQEFMWMWLALVFFIKKYDDYERPSLEKLVNDLDEEAIDKFVDTTTLVKIKTLASLNIKNETRQNNCYEEAENLQGALVNSTNKKEILRTTLLQLYVVRCNLFHGDKAWTIKRDNDVMACATPLLGIIVGKLVEN